MDHIVEQEDYKNLVIKIYPDQDAESPREDCNLGTMVCFHGGYNLGDKHDFLTPDDLHKHLKKIERNGGMYLPLYLYDHSGITMATTPFSCPWDSGQVGYIYVTGEKIREEYCVKRISKVVRGKIVDLLTSEVRTYDQYLRGDICGYVIENEEGVPVESCWGYYGTEEAMDDAKSIAEWLINDSKDLQEQEVA